ncbi:MAG: hypothetical protein HOE55_07550, partial [Thiotrichales bacterium]|nr:hypothetical protein [Thiotrichales bacterium]
MGDSGKTRAIPISTTTGQRARLWSMLLVVLIIQLPELFLMERKYYLFTGSFLQPYSYLTWTDRSWFILISLWTDLVLITGVGLPWFWLSDRLQVRPLLAAYNFAFIFSAAMGLWLGLKYKVLSYFNDTLNFLIIQNLGGGSVLEAFSYVANEWVIIGIGLVVLAA